LGDKVTLGAGSNSN